MTARAAIGGPADGTGDERACALAIGRLLAGQRTTHRLEGLPEGSGGHRVGFEGSGAGGAGGSQQHGVVGGLVAIDADLIPGPGHDGPQQPVQGYRLGDRVGEHEGEHGGHVGVDHAHALGHATDRDAHRVSVGSGQVHDHRCRLGPRIGGPQRLGHIGEGGIIGSESVGDSGFDRVCDSIYGQAGADEPGGHREDMLLVGACRRGQCRCQGALIGQASCSGGGIGTAAGGHQRARPAVATATGRFRGREMLLAQTHGRGGQPIGRERRGHRGRTVLDHDECQVGRARRLDPGHRARDAESSRESGPGLGLGQVRWQSVKRPHGTMGNCSRPVVSGRPKTMLKACTA